MEKTYSKEVRKGLLEILTGESSITFGLYNEPMTLSEQIKHLEDLIEHCMERDDETAHEMIPRYEAQMAAFEWMKEAIEKALI